MEDYSKTNSVLRAHENLAQHKKACERKQAIQIKPNNAPTQCSTSEFIPSVFAAATATSTTANISTTSTTSTSQFVTTTSSACISTNTIIHRIVNHFHQILERF